MKIAIGCDHAAFIEKQKILEFLKELGHTVIDLGTHGSESVNYPKYGHNVAKMVVENKVDKGIVLCGSGIGISIAANKIKGARAALCTSIEHAEMSRRHNDSNVLALGARIKGGDNILDIVDKWLTTDFEGDRHQRRIEKIEIV